MTEQTTSEQTRPATTEEQLKKLFDRTSRLNDALSALIDPEWGAKAGLLPVTHPLHPNVRAPRPLTEGEKAALEAAGLPAGTRITQDVVDEALFDAPRYKQDYLKACEAIAAMHAAATGRTGEGPIRGVVEDVEDVRLRAEQAEAERDEARQWARHGYEIGQRHCGWSDHGVAPAWLTEGWPPHIDSCEHLKQMAEFDEALTRVKAVLADPSALDWRRRVRAAIGQDEEQ